MYKVGTHIFSIEFSAAEKAPGKALSKTTARTLEGRLPQYHPFLCVAPPQGMEGKESKEDKKGKGKEWREKENGEEDLLFTLKVSDATAPATVPATTPAPATSTTPATSDATDGTTAASASAPTTAPASSPATAAAVQTAIPPKSPAASKTAHSAREVSFELDGGKCRIVMQGGRNIITITSTAANSAGSTKQKQQQEDLFSAAEAASETEATEAETSQRAAHHQQVCVMECSGDFRNCTAYSPTDFALNNFIMMLYAFNAVRYSTLLMHSSVIIKRNKETSMEVGKIEATGEGEDNSNGYAKAYMFLGKSGTGKSTHSALWLKHIEGCTLLNDDNPVVKVDANSRRATVYGSPWSGKTHCYKNESAAIGAFVQLHQAPKNEIRKESAAHAFAILLPSFSVLKENEKIYREAISAVTALASFSNVYTLNCRPDKEAALLCRNTVAGDNSDAAREKTKEQDDCKSKHAGRKIKQLPKELMMREIADLAGSGYAVTITVKGNSMRPFLADGRDKVILKGLEENEKNKSIKTGDVLLARDLKGNIYLHRVIKRNGNLLKTQGDGNYKQTEDIVLKDIMGRVTDVIRKGKKYPVNGCTWKTYSYIWNALRPVRHLLLAVIARLR